MCLRPHAIAVVQKGVIDRNFRYQAPAAGSTMLYIGNAVRRPTARVRFVFLSQHQSAIDIFSLLFFLLFLKFLQYSSSFQRFASFQEIVDLHFKCHRMVLQI